MRKIQPPRRKSETVSDFKSLGRRETVVEPKPLESIYIMRKPISLMLILTLLIGAVPLLAACHTTAGAGQDLSATGHAITGAAHKETP